MEKATDAGAGTVATTLRWAGDNISFDPAKPATVELRPGSGGPTYLSVQQALAVADQIDAYGLGRITAALSFASENGYLCAEDLTAWQQWRKDRS